MTEASLVSSVPVALDGQQVVYTLTVSSAAGTPSGSASICDGYTAFATCVSGNLDAAGQLVGTLSWSASAGSPRFVGGNYFGSGSYGASYSTIGQAVAK